MTTTPPAEADHIQDQLCARIDELEAEKLALIDENERPALRRALGDDLWESWPRMTIGRIDEARRRRKAA